MRCLTTGGYPPSHSSGIIIISITLPRFPAGDFAVQNTDQHATTPEIRSLQLPSSLRASADVADDNMHLAKEFNPGDVEMDEIFGFDDAEDGNEGEFEQEIDTDDFDAFQTHTRMTETRHAEANRGEGGIKTQQQVKKQYWPLGAES